MTAKGRRSRKQEPWRVALDEFPDDDLGETNARPESKAPIDADEALPVVHPVKEAGLDVIQDIDYQGRKYTVEEAPLVLGSDGDDAKQLTKIKLRIDGNGDQERTLASLAPGDMLSSGHGFIVDDQRSRPWKTAHRTHCAHCGGPLPGPDLSGFRCEIDPEASEAELALIGGGDHGPDPDWPFSRLTQRLHKGCQCSGCSLRWLVANGHERGVGQPRKYCSADCRRWADNERNAWKRAVVRAEKRGDVPPSAPEDKGLKFYQAGSLRASIEGTGHRYVAAYGLPWRLPRA